MRALIAWFWEASRSWPFPLVRYKKTNKDLTGLVLAFLSQPDLHLVECDDYYAEVRCVLGSLRVWIGNDSFGFASQGCFSHIDGRQEVWESCQPSRYASRKMMKWLKVTKDCIGNSFKLGPYNPLRIHDEIVENFYTWGRQNGYDLTPSKDLSKRFDHYATEHAWRGYLFAKKGIHENRR